MTLSIGPYAPLVTVELLRDRLVKHVNRNSKVGGSIMSSHVCLFVRSTPFGFGAVERIVPFSALLVWALWCFSKCGPWGPYEKGIFGLWWSWGAQLTLVCPYAQSLVRRVVSCFGPVCVCMRPLGEVVNFSQIPRCYPGVHNCTTALWKVVPWSHHQYPLVVACQWPTPFRMLYYLHALECCFLWTLLVRPLDVWR